MQEKAHLKPSPPDEARSAVMFSVMPLVCGTPFDAEHSSLTTYKTYTQHTRCMFSHVNGKATSGFKTDRLPAQHLDKVDQ